MTKWLVPISLALAFPLFADDKPKKLPIETFLDAKKAGSDFEIQGEYVAESSDGKIAIQVVAEGDGKFGGRGYLGGLPGDGWDGSTIWKHAGQTENGVTTIESSEGKGVYRDGKFVVTTNSGTTFEMKRVERKSPTEGLKPPAGAIVLFDGKNADAWDKGKVVEGKLLQMGVNSKQKFSDFTMHLEFRLPYMPRARGQARANSGVYPQGRYEVQVLDSFGLDGKDNECGGVYQIADPKVNMCYPPLAWQTYDIDFTAAKYADGKKVKNARLTVKHNGVVVQDDLELKKTTPGGGVNDGPEPGPLHLQNHGNPVYYRNIWLVEKK